MFDASRVSRHRRLLPSVSVDDATPPQVAPVSAGPLFSVMIPTYNCAGMLRETLSSVLAQDPGPDVMQIQVIDDCSDDDPEAVVRELGGGRVEFFRQPVNRGAIAAFNTCVDRSRGALVHILHGDDWVLPGFYDEIARLAREHPAAGLYATGVICTDEVGSELLTMPRVTSAETAPTTDPSFNAAGNVLQFAGCVARRSSYEASGGFLPLLVHTADWEMWVRLTSNHGLSTSPQALACYRLSPGNDTSRLARSAGNVIDIDRSVSVALLRDYGVDASRLMRTARSAALGQARRFAASGDRAGARANLDYWRERAGRFERVRGHAILGVSRLRAAFART